MIRAFWFACIALAVPLAAAGDVVDRAPNGFLIRSATTIAAPPDRVFNALVADIDVWWDSAHTFSGQAGNLWLTANPGGCLCETMRQGGGVEHAVVIHSVPGEILRLRGAFGPLQEYGIAGTLTWQFAPLSDGGTTATVSYSAGGYFPGGFDAIADPVDSVFTDLLRRLKEYVERGGR